MFLVILHTYRLFSTKNEGSSCDINIGICAYEQSNAEYSRMNGKPIKNHVNGNECANSYRFNPRSQIYSSRIG